MIKNSVILMCFIISNNQIISQEINEKDLVGVWSLYDLSPKSLDSLQNVKDIFKITLEKDNRYIYLFNEIVEKGNWRLDTHHLKLNEREKGTTTFSIFYLSKNRDTLILNRTLEFIDPVKNYSLKLYRKL